MYTPITFAPYGYLLQSMQLVDDGDEIGDDFPPPVVCIAYYRATISSQ